MPEKMIMETLNEDKLIEFMDEEAKNTNADVSVILCEPNGTITISFPKSDRENRRFVNDVEEHNMKLLITDNARALNVCVSIAKDYAKEYTIKNTFYRISMGVVRNANGTKDMCGLETFIAQLNQ